MIVAVLTLLGAIGVGKKVSDAINSDDPDDIDKSPGGTSDKSPDGTSDKSPDGPSDPKGEIADLKDKIAAAEKMGASQNVIDGLIRELNAKEKSLYIAQGPGKGESQELSEARYAASNLLKNIEYYDDIISNANPQNIEFINRMKKQQDFYKSDYADIVKKISELAPNDPSNNDADDDEGAVVPDLDKLDKVKIKPTDTSEGTRIAEYINPSEVKLFLSTDQESKDEQKRYEEFSRVQPGNSLGNAGTNPLIRVNNQYYKKQFQNADKTMEKRRPYIVPTVEGIRRRPWSDPQFVNIYDGYEHGKVRFEADDYHTNRFMSNTLYNPMLVTDEFREFERPSTFHPELKLAGYRFKPTTIPEIRTQAGYKGVDSRPSINNNINIAPKQTGYTFSEMRRDDNFTGTPQKVRTQLTGFNQPVRIKSTRGGR